MVCRRANQAAWPPRDADRATDVVLVRVERGPRAVVGLPPHRRRAHALASGWSGHRATPTKGAVAADLSKPLGYAVAQLPAVDDSQHAAWLGYAPGKRQRATAREKMRDGGAHTRYSLVATRYTSLVGCCSVPCVRTHRSSGTPTGCGTRKPTNWRSSGAISCDLVSVWRPWRAGRLASVRARGRSRTRAPPAAPADACQITIHRKPPSQPAARWPSPRHWQGCHSD